MKLFLWYLIPTVILLGCQGDQQPVQLEPGSAIEYRRFEYHTGFQDPRQGSLIAFVYDLPYFTACNQIPPFELANQYFRQGIIGTGDKAGAKWAPFYLSRNHYDQLIQTIQSTDPNQLRGQSRYPHNRLKTEFAQSTETDEARWRQLACQGAR